MSAVRFSVRVLTRFNLPSLFVALFLMMTASVVQAQIVETGTITGVVKDNSGAVVPNAHVTVRDTGTGLVLLCHKRWIPQNGQRQSWRSRDRARMMRNVAMECGLCRSGRMRAAGLEVGREFGD